MAGPKKMSASELKAFRAEKRQERLAIMERASALRAQGLTLKEIAEQMALPLSTVATWLAIRAAGERALIEHAERERRVAS